MPQDLTTDKNQLDVLNTPKRPLVLGFFAFVLSAQAALLPILFIVFLLMPGDSVGTFYGVERPLGEVRLEMLAILAVWFAFTAYVGPGLWRGSSNARHVAFGVYVSVPLIGIVIHGVYSEIPFYLICCAIVGWYLYGKSNVRDFFDAEGNAG